MRAVVYAGTRRFLITGYPRSRTAWLSAWLSSSKTICLHDAIKDCAGIEDMPNLLWRRWLESPSGIDTVGVADSCLPLYAQKLPALFPQTRLLIIDRPKAHAQKSFLEYFTKHAYPGLPLEAEKIPARFDQAEAGLSWLRENWSGDVRSYAFESLDHPKVAQDIWEYITGSPFDRKRWEMFNQFRINVIPEKVSTEKIKQRLERSAPWVSE